VIDLRTHEHPDGKYLIEGGGPRVWNQFRLRKEHRRLQGIIHGKRCGTTENIGPAARGRRSTALHSAVNSSFVAQSEFLPPAHARG
jgi:hypothetical protein